MTFQTIPLLLNSLGKSELTSLTLKRLEAIAAAKRENSVSSWRKVARPEQIEPSGDWSTWLILAGRGWGKTRTGAEWFREQAQHSPYLRIIAPTFADARDVCVEGESGLKKICLVGELVTWNRSMGEGEFNNGSRFKVFSGAEPERLRGPQSHADWYDELAAWAYPRQTWDMAQMGLRLGTKPRVVVTTTPRPNDVIRELIKLNSTHITRGTTYDNRANLAASFFEHIINRYEGTRLGRQELNAELLEDVIGSLWVREWLDRLRVTVVPELVRIVVAIDPSAGSKDSSDEAGIIVAGLGKDKHGYILGDYTLRGTPSQWASEAIAAYHRHKADRIVAESNNGGEMVEAVIRGIVGGETIPYTTVWASDGKRTRAEPVSALYEQNKIHHVGSFPALEDEQCGWIPGEGKSPNRIDALVWAIHELGLVKGFATLSAVQPMQRNKYGGYDNTDSTESATGDEKNSKWKNY